MNLTTTTFLLLTLFLISTHNSIGQNTSPLNPDEEVMVKMLDDKFTEYAELAHTIWKNPELGYVEKKSSQLLKEKLIVAGFKVEDGVAGIPTAFSASFGSGTPVIGILAEFDALPGFSQDAVPYKKERQDCTSGHACGHHLFGTASTAAGIAIGDWLKRTGHQGTIKVFGTPAEEGGAGKVYMAKEGVFNKVDIMLHWHPSDDNSAVAESCLAIKTAKFRFHGISSHAGGSPELGRSALDGVEAMNVMTNFLREHIPQEARMHYVITNGGAAPNVVPAEAEVYYAIRHPQMMEVKSIFDRVVKCAEGAALGTGTTMDYEIISGAYNLLINETLSTVVDRNMRKVGGVFYNKEELVFARKMLESYPDRKVNLKDTETIVDFRVTEEAIPFSTDVGDVSWLVPTAGMSTATWVPGTSAHSWQAVAAGGTSIAHKGMINAAKTLALSAVEIFNNPQLVLKATKELKERQGENFTYEALLGDRKPPLDYRKNN
jgi:amidohydrolase